MFSMVEDFFEQDMDKDLHEEKPQDTCKDESLLREASKISLYDGAT